MNLLNSLRNFGKAFFASILSTFRIKQLGVDIDGEATTDEFGWSVSMNAVGDKMIVGARVNDGATGTNSGHVRIYYWSGTAWTLQAEIDGQAANSEVSSVSMNAVGDRIIFGMKGVGPHGAARVYNWTGSAWQQFGATLVGSPSGADGNSDLFGSEVSMNAAGDRVAISSPWNDGSASNAGCTRVFYWSGTAWTQLGSDIRSEGTGDLGIAVSLNAIGDVVALGSMSNDGVTGADSGHVRVYRWTGSAWTKIGDDIDGEVAGDLSGTSVSLNAVGDIVAIGARYNAGNGVRSGHVRVYRWTGVGTAWTKIGNDIDGEAVSDESGTWVSLNAVGDRVAIGAPYNDGTPAAGDRGHVRIYSWNGLAWTKLATDIDGEAAGDGSGRSVSMNAIGDRVVIGGPFNDGTPVAADRGHVRVYSIEDLRYKFWAQLGGNINGEFANDNSGWSVAMNAAGDRVVIGAPNNDGVGGFNSGHVRVYRWTGSAWQQLGNDIDGDELILNDKSGYSVSINMAGDRIAIAAPFNDGTTGVSSDNRGCVRIYSWSGTAWNKLGADILGEATGDQSGWSISMNDVGDRVAIGAIYNDGTTGTDRGHVRIYSWNGTAWSQFGLDIDGEAADDWSGHSVSMNSVGDKVVIGSPYNSDGGINCGSVRVYSWSGTAWNQLGLDMNGRTSFNEFGYSVSMNAAGDRIVIGARYGDGYARAYSWNGTAWNQLGLDIDGEASQHQSGYSVSMNAAGDRIAISSPYKYGLGASESNSGRVKIYTWNGSAWNQLGFNIDGEAEIDYNGYSVSLNAAGDRVAIGAINNDNISGTDSGSVKVYELKT